MIINLHPAWLSVAALVAGVLGLFAFRRMGHLTRTSMLTVTRIGIVLIAPALFLFGLMYVYFALHPETTTQVYAPYVSLPLLYLLISIAAWFVVTLRLGREL